MKFVSKDLAIKLKEKSFDRPCFGWYHITTPPGAFEGRLNLNESSYRGETYHRLLKRNISEYNTNPNLVNAPTIEQVLEWLREDCGLHIAMVCSRNYDIDADGRVLGSWVYWWYEVYAHLSANLIYQEEEKEYEIYDEAILDAIEYVVNNLI